MGRRVTRYLKAESVKGSCVARQLNINRGTVKRVLARAGLPTISLRPRPSRIDPFLPFIHQTLEKFPVVAGHFSTWK
jgi:transposase